MQEADGPRDAALGFGESRSLEAIGDEHSDDEPWRVGDGDASWGSPTGANVVGAHRLAERLGPGAVIVTLAVDSGFKYERRAVRGAVASRRAAGRRGRSRASDAISSASPSRSRRDCPEHGHAAQAGGLRSCDPRSASSIATASAASHAELLEREEIALRIGLASRSRPRPRRSRRRRRGRPPAAPCLDLGARGARYDRRAALARPLGARPPARAAARSSRRPARSRKSCDPAFQHLGGRRMPGSEPPLHDLGVGATGQLVEVLVLARAGGPARRTARGRSRTGRLRRRRSSR